MVGMQDEDAIHRARQDRVRLVFLGRHRVAHAQEIGGVVEIVLRIHEGLADRIFVRHCGEGRHFCDHADRSDHALMRIGDVGGVVIESRQCADTTGHHSHRMRVTAEALEEPAHLFMDHRVAGHAIVKICLLRGGRQFAVEQEVTRLQEIPVLGELLNRIAAIEQDTLVAIDIGDLGLTAGRGGESRVIGEHPALAVKLRNVDDVGTDRAGINRHVPVIITDRQCAGFILGAGLGVHGGALELAANDAALCVSHSSVHRKIAQCLVLPGI